MQINFENLTIGVFAKAAGVNVETIRFYQRKGLLPEPDKPYGSIRRYGEADVTRVRFVKSAQRLGFSLDEIAELLRLEDGTHCEEASGLAEHKLKDVREKMADLARMEAVLSELVCACHARKGNVSCPLIASLQDGTKLAASARRWWRCSSPGGASFGRQPPASRARCARSRRCAAPTSSFSGSWPRWFWSRSDFPTSCHFSTDRSSP